MINYLAVDYSDDLPVKIKEICAFEAKDSRGQDALNILANNDNNYLKMPDIGDKTELIFKSPTRSAGLERTVILKAGGYYDIHLQAEGEPQRELLERIHFEPGFSVRYTFKEYLKWKKEILKETQQE